LATKGGGEGPSGPKKTEALDKFKEGKKEVRSEKSSTTSTASGN